MELLSSDNQAVALIDRNGAIVGFSPAFEKLSGCPRSSLDDGLHLRKIMSRSEMLITSVQSVLGGSKITDITTELYHWNDGVFTVQISLFPAYGKERVPLAALLFVDESRGIQKDYPELVNRLGQFQKFASIVKQIIPSHKTESLYQLLTDSIVDVSDFSRASVTVFDGVTGKSIQKAASGLSREEQALNRKVNLEVDTFIQTYLKEENKISGNTYYISAAPADKGGSSGQSLSRRWRGSDKIVFPILIEEEILGFVQVSDSKTGYVPSTEDISPLETFIDQICLVISKNLGFEEDKLKHKDLQLVHDIALQVNSSLDLEEVLNNLAEEIHSRLESDHTSIFLLENNMLIRKALVGKITNIGHVGIAVGEGLIGKACYTMQPVLVNDTSHDPDYLTVVSTTLSELAVPIISTAFIDGKETESVIGVLNAESSVRNFFTSEDQSRMEAVASTASMAIENSRLMDRVLSLLKEEANYSQELEAKKAELDEFVHTISHDLKSPLNSIAGYAEMLEFELGQKKDERIERYLKRINANVTVISRMISDLLELSRVGRVDEDMTLVSVEAQLREIVFDLRVANEDAGAEIVFSNLPAQVYVNSRRLTQLLTNLISNAIKYSHPDRVPRIEISCRQEGDKYVFAVTDNGLGIEKEHLDSIFVFGVRVREKAADGTGAGLAIAKKIVESHGGKIWATSKKGIGSTFYFSIPVYTS